VPCNYQLEEAKFEQLKGSHCVAQARARAMRAAMDRPLETPTMLAAPVATAGAEEAGLAAVEDGLEGLLLGGTETTAEVRVLVLVAGTVVVAAPEDGV
jgi:hypothetical protein